MNDKDHNFDAFIFELLATMAMALRNKKGEMHLTTDEDRTSLDVLNQVISQEKIDFFVTLPEILANIDKKSLAKILKIVISMGSAPFEETFKELLSINPNLLVGNGYGPTEAGICTSINFYKLSEDPRFIGVPISNIKYYIVNPHTLELCDIGQKGEIYIVGEGVGNGYSNNKELSEKKFQWVILDKEQHALKKCLPTTPGAVRAYVSGDYGCYAYTSDKKLNVKFLCREDRECKISGVRIELDAIEMELHKLTNLIKDPVVVFDGERLITYYVPVNQNIDEVRQQVNAHFEKSFPKQAIPSFYVPMNEIPITQNGKVDTRSLPNIESVVKNIEPPRTELQSQLLKLWSETLKLSPTLIDVNTSFGALGGHSLKLAKLNSLLKKHLFQQPEFSKFKIKLNLDEDITITSLETLIQSQKKRIYSITGNKITLYNSPNRDRNSKSEVQQIKHIPRKNISPHFQ